MKKQILLVLLIALCFIGYNHAQNTDILAISSSKVIDVYTNLQNPITIAVAGIPAEKIFVTTSAGTLTGEKGKYILTLPDSKTQYLKEVKLTIYELLKHGKQREIGIRNLRVKSVPKPLPVISSDNCGNSKDFSAGIIKFKDTKQLDQVTVKLENFYFKDIDYKVVKYKFLYLPKDTMQNQFIAGSDNSKLTEEMKTVLNNAQDQAIIMIYDIDASFSGSVPVRLPASISLTVKK